MVHTHILTEAAKIVDGDREQTYGRPDRNLRAIADLWDSWLLARGWSGPGLGIDDVACLMALLKLARLANSPYHRDSMVDVCGYMRLMERCQEHEAQATPHPPGGEGERGGAGSLSHIPTPHRESKLKNDTTIASERNRHD